jgi:hypothetical protein
VFSGAKEMAFPKEGGSDTGLFVQELKSSGVTRDIWLLDFFISFEKATKSKLRPRLADFELDSER